jgi:hypothetical protein
MKVADLTIDEFRELIREMVCEVLEEQRLEDEGGLRPEFEAELRASLESPAEGVPLEKVAKELGIEL